jgi:outer membrane protein assembly factor BamB
MPHTPSKLFHALVLLGMIGASFLVSTGCRLKRGDLQGEFLGSGLNQRHSRRVLSVVWRRHVDPNYTHKVLTWKLSPEEGATPTLDSKLDQVCVGSERQFFSCFDRFKGQRKWFKKISGRIVSQAVIHGDTYIVGTTSGTIYSFNRSNGNKGWKKPYQADGEILSTPILIKLDKHPPLVVFTTSNNKMYALNANTGEWKWLYRRDPPEQLTVRGQAPATYADGLVFSGFSDGTVSAINPKTGAKVWERSIKSSDRFPDVDSGIVVNEGQVFASSYSGSFYALKAKTGKIIWKQKIRAATRPVVSDGHVFVSTSNGSIYKLDAEQGKMLWKKPHKFRKAGAFTDLIADDYHIYASSSGYGIFVLGRDKGKLIQILRFGNTGFAPPMRSGSNFYVLSYSSFLYSLTSKRHNHAQR